jgi:hypothetical protein
MMLGFAKHKEFIMAGKVRVRTLFGYSHYDVELRNWMGYNVTRRLASEVPYAKEYGKWYVYHDGGGWVLIHGDTGLSAGYGKTIKDSFFNLAVRKKEELKESVSKYPSLHSRGLR